MKHSRFGLILLLSSGAALACNGDPTSSIREGSPARIITTPSVIFLNQGATTFLTVQLVDAQGSQLATAFDATSAGPQATLVRDTTFLQTTNGSNLGTADRFLVTAGDAGQTKITVTASGATVDVPVSAVPTSVSATFSNPAAAVNEPVTITLPAGYTFGTDAGVETDLGPGFVQSISADNTAISALLPPGSSGPVTLSGVNASFLPGLSLTVPSVDPVATDATPAAGTGSTATAPEITVPALDGTTTFFDTGPFTAADITGDGGVGAQYYKITITETGSYHFVTDWAGTSDIDAVVCVDAACSDGSFAGTGTTQPEDGSLTLTPGTYYYSVVLFAGTAPPYFVLQLTHDAPPAP